MDVLEGRVAAGEPRVESQAEQEEQENGEAAAHSGRPGLRMRRDSIVKHAGGTLHVHVRSTRREGRVHEVRARHGQARGYQQPEQPQVVSAKVLMKVIADPAVQVTVGVPLLCILCCCVRCSRQRREEREVLQLSRQAINCETEALVDIATPPPAQIGSADEPCHKPAPGDVPALHYSV